MSTNKPDLTRVWAETAPPANVVDPDITTPGKVTEGWTAEVPPFEHFNFLQKWFTQGLAHINEQGIAVWDSKTVYPIGALSKGSNNIVYQSLLEQFNNDPVVDSGSNWKVFKTIVDPKDFGAIGDGIANDSQAMENAINASSGKILDGSGSTYRLDDVFITTSENLTIQNMVLDMSNILDQAGSPDRVITFQGSQNSFTELDANALKGTNVLDVDDSSDFTIDTNAWISSSAIFNSGDSTVLGQIVKIKSIDTPTQVTLYDDVLYDFNTSDSARLSTLETKKNITLNNISVIGSNANIQSAFYFDKCENLILNSCTFLYCHYSAASFSRCINVDIDKCTVKYARSTGLSYGFTIGNGCYSVRVQNGYGQDMRHYVTVGDNDGVNLFINVSGNHIKSASDGAIDSHPACDFMIINGNTIEGSSSDSGNHDGIVFQGLNCMITDNLIVGMRRHSIMCQHFPDIGIASCLISGNNIQNSGEFAGTDTGIQVSAEGNNIIINSVNISNNIINGSNEYAIFILANTGNINVLNINSNSALKTTGKGIFVNAETGYSIDKLNISLNIMDGDSANEALYLLGENIINITNATVSGNTFDGFVFGIRATLVDELNETGNLILNSSDPYEINSNCTNIYLDTKRFPNITVTNSTFTLEEHNDYIICNRADTITLTLRGASEFPGKILNIKNIQAELCDSSSSNVVPINSSSPGSSILPAINGAWCMMRSDGSNWIIMQQG